MKTTKRWLSLLLSLIMVVGIFAIAPVTVSATQLSESEFVSKISILQSTFRHGEYWNKYNSSNYSQTGSKPCSGYSTETGQYCTSRGYCVYCTCDCGYFDGAWQCMGYAYKMAYECFGISVRNTSYWEKSNSLGTICAGDVIRLNNYNNTISDWHSIFVYKVVGDTIYYTECNNAGPCKVTWGNTMSYSSINNRFCYKLHYKGNTLTGNGTHTHSYDTYVYYWDAHPHYKCYQCSCGEVKENTSEPTYVSSCTSCNPSHNLGSVFYSTIVNSYLGTSLTGADDNNVESYALSGSQKQWWKFENCGNNEYKITNCSNGLCLDVYCGLGTNNTNVQLYESNDTNAQRWYIRTTTNGYTLVPKCAPSLCIDIENTSSEEGTNVQIYNCNLNNAQVFSIPYRLESEPCDLGNMFDSTIINTSSGKAITNKDGKVQMFTADGSYSQAWCFVKDKDNSYSIYSYRNWGKCLDVMGGSSENFTEVIVYEENNTNAQRWFIVKDGTNSYRLVPRCATQKTLDVVDANTDDGAGLQIFDNHRNNAQYFSLNPNTLPFKILDYGKVFEARIINVGTNKLVVGTTDGNVEIGSNRESDNSLWKFTQNEDGSYTIVNKGQNLCLDVDCGTQYNYTNIGLYSSNGTTAQKWYLINLNGSVAFVPACALMRAMDVKATDATDGTNIELFTYQESPAQKYIIKVIKESAIQLGDANVDNKVSIQDATAIQKHIASIITLSEDGCTLADVDASDDINIKDATAIQKYIAGIETGFPIG